MILIVVEKDGRPPSRGSHTTARRSLATTAGHCIQSPGGLQQIGALFFLFWILVLLAGADKPPPLGFVWIVLAVAACALVVY